MAYLILYADGHEDTIAATGTIHTEPDRHMAEREFHADALVLTHMNLYDCEGCRACDGARRVMREIREERERREQDGIREIVDPVELTLEERLAPYGEQSQFEQRLRREEGY